MSEQYENNKCLVHLIFWSHPWSLHPLTHKHNYITFNDHITYTKQNIQLNINSNSCSWNQYVFCECPRPHILFGQAGQEAVTEHVVKLPLTPPHCLHGAMAMVTQDSDDRSSSAGQLDTYITPSPHHPWPAGGWGWCEAAWRQAGLLTTHYTALHCTGHTDTGHGGFGEMRSGH